VKSADQRRGPRDHGGLGRDHESGDDAPVNELESKWVADLRVAAPADWHAVACVLVSRARESVVDVRSGRECSEPSRVIALSRARKIPVRREFEPSRVRT